MLLSIWRSSHLFLGLIAGVFIAISALSGSFLALEPISNFRPGLSENQLAISVEVLLKKLSDQYEEVYQITKTKSNCLIAEVVTKENETKTIYINPNTALSLGDVSEKSKAFQKIRAFHRSLFLKKTGRIIMSVTTTSLLLMLLSGILLLLDRYGNVFSILRREKSLDNWGSWHVVISKYFLFPIFLVAFSGIVLSFDTLGFWKNSFLSTENEISYSKKENALGVLKLGQVSSITFPFSTAEEDYFSIETDIAQLEVHQYTGEVISQNSILKPFFSVAWSYRWHTGEGNLWWAVILCITGIGISFLVISGIFLGIKRLKILFKKTKNKLTIEECELNIFVGSQTGNTWVFGKALFESLNNLGLKIGIWPLEFFEIFENTRRIIVLTSTYGDGAPPVKIIGLKERIEALKPNHEVLYSVVGFGSSVYPKYCAFAENINMWFQSHACFKEEVSLFKIDEQNEVSFNEWCEKWGTQNNLELLEVFPSAKEQKNKKFVDFVVLEKSSLNCDNTFVLKLKPQVGLEYTSGDIIGVEASQGRAPRFYSIAVVKEVIWLSVKKHEFGLCSTYLSELKVGGVIRGFIEKNEEFYLTHSIRKVILIANGTGIAPYLGMISNNEEANISLFWGGRNFESLQLYRPFLEEQIQSKKLQSLHTIFSREGRKGYVQDLIVEQEDLFLDVLNSNGKIFICGSLKMQQGIEEALEKIIVRRLHTSLVYFKNSKQVKADCY